MLTIQREISDIEPSRMKRITRIIANSIICLSEEELRSKFETPKLEIYMKLLEKLELVQTRIDKKGKKTYQSTPKGIEFLKDYRKFFV